MKLEILEYLCKANNVLWNIPHRIYVNKEIHSKYEQVTLDQDFVDRYFDKLYENPRDFSILITSKLLFLALIKVKGTNFSILIGPERSVKLSEKEIRSIISENKLDMTNIAHFIKYFNSVELMPFENFSRYCTNLNFVINEETTDLESFYREIVMYDFYMDNYKNVINYMDVEEAGYITVPYQEQEKQLLFYIRHGMEDELRRHLHNWRGRPTSFLEDGLRQYKDRCISMTTLVSREAIKGGLNSDVSYRLFDLYCKKVELATNVESLNELQVVMMLDFTKRMKACIFEETQNPTINRVIAHIHKHLNKKLSVTAIAEELKLNPGYLSHLFIKNVGMSLSSYISHKKIDEAKRILRMTDKPLIEISEYLRFSSQSYFQNVFRNITGLTPMEYRNKTTDDDEI